MSWPRSCSRLVMIPSRICWTWKRLPFLVPFNIRCKGGQVRVPFSSQRVISSRHCRILLLFLFLTTEEELSPHPTHSVLHYYFPTATKQQHNNHTQHNHHNASHPLSSRTPPFRAPIRWLRLWRPRRRRQLQTLQIHRPDRRPLSNRSSFAHQPHQAFLETPDCLPNLPHLLCKWSGRSRKHVQAVYCWCRRRACIPVRRGDGEEAGDAGSGAGVPYWARWSGELCG